MWYWPIVVANKILGYSFKDQIKDNYSTMQLNNHKLNKNGNHVRVTTQPF